MSDREKQKQEKRIRIIEAAAQVFAEKGFAGTLMAEVAVRAGIGKGTIYEYFRSKDDLFFDVFEWFMMKSLKEVSVNISALSGRVSIRLEAMNESVLNSISKMKPLYGLSLEFWAASASSAMHERFKNLFKEMYDNYRRIISSLIQEGIDCGDYRSDVDSESIASAITGTWDSLGLQAWFDQGFDLLMVGRSFISVIIRGLSSSETS